MMMIQIGKLNNYCSEMSQRTVILHTMTGQTDIVQI